jgi:hypothetical protein
MELIRQEYGRTLKDIERTLWPIIADYFLDRDGFIYSCINKTTLKPFQDSDPEVNAENWVARGDFPNELKRTYLNYEDSDMAAGDYLMALVSKARRTGDPKVGESARRFFRAMMKLYDSIARKNPYGAGWLCKPYGGIERVEESLECSADQYLKFTVALEKYLHWTEDAQERQQITDALCAFARWLDDRDFVTPYMGRCAWGRLHSHTHWVGYFAYIMALGHRLSGNEHYRQEALFFMDKMLRRPRLSGNAERDRFVLGERARRPPRLSGNASAMNLVVEQMDRLIDLMPEYRTQWLDIMAQDWDDRVNYVDADGIAHYDGYRWNEGAGLASTYNTIVKHFPEKKNDLDLRTLLLKYNEMDRFVHQLSSDDPNNMTYYVDRFEIVSQHLSSWLRGYWESELPAE